MAETVAELMTKEEVLARVPQQEPFRFIDEIVELSDDHIVGRYRFRDDEFFYRGHFPGDPIVPGVLLLEGLAQTLAYYLLRRWPNARVLLTGFDRCRLRRPVRPGERIRYEVEVERLLLNVATARGVVGVAGQTAATATVKGWVGRDE